TNTGVTWSVVEGATHGSVSASGLYTAPATLPTPPTATVRATSDADPTEHADATVTITDSPPGDNVLSVGTGTVPAAIPLRLENEEAVKGVQTDVQFDPAVVSYVSGEATGRGAGMSFSASVVGGNAVRVVLYYADASTLPAGSGAIANLTFECLESPDSSVLTPTNTILSDPSGDPLGVTNEPGSVTCGGGTEIEVTVSPAAATVQVGMTQQFTATVTGTTNTGVTWSVVEGATYGSISGSGLYTAPATLPSPPAATVRATSVADPSEFDEAAVTITDPDPPEGNVLSMGEATGQMGGQASVPLNLENEDVVKGVQTDVQFDPAVVSYVSGEATGRGTGMSYSASVVGGNKVRVILYYADATTLPAGSGPLADLTFSLIGADGSSTPLTPTATILSDPAGDPLPVTEEAGEIAIGGAAPTLEIFVLRNPGRLRNLQVFVAADQNLASLAVSAGGTPVAMEETDPVHEIHRGTVHVSESLDEILISATGTNGSGEEGSVQTTLTF
ncbi:MAG: hypothetical protein GF346_10570, partial [Candidatus Eisenbacteria bacterium]|nr:hypothetical protein [Candidatus Latescibacterota bacterium]MBD3302880.1 hypothetical protein [Candidatus Eisenbacteria bacterium]